MGGQPRNKTPRGQQSRSGQVDQQAGYVSSDNNSGQDVVRFQGRQHQKAAGSGSASQSPGPKSIRASREVKATPVKNPTTPSKQAYAGATFHTSPAPSSLPIPSFISKSVPELPSTLEDQETTNDSPQVQDASSRPQSAAVGKSMGSGESPLDIFFKADRAEKARANSNSRVVSGPARLSPAPTDRDSSPSTKTRPQHSRNQTEEMFPIEIDGSGSGGRTPGPAFATPYKERMDALRSRGQSASPSHEGHDPAKRQQQEDALKEMLMSPSTKPTLTPRHPFGAPAANATIPAGRSVSTSASSRPSNLRQEVPRPQVPEQGTPPPPRYDTRAASRSILETHLNGNGNAQAKSASGQRPFDSVDPKDILNAHYRPSPPPSTKSPQVKNLEDDLRRMLNLGT